MKNINYHFNLRFPSDFYDQEAKSEIIGLSEVSIMGDPHVAMMHVVRRN